MDTPNIIDDYQINIIDDYQLNIIDDYQPAITATFIAENEPINIPTIEPEDIVLDKNIGSGNEANVYQATIKQTVAQRASTVAVKTFKKGNAYNTEANIHRAFKHPNIIPLLGLVEASGIYPHGALVLGLATKGSLQHYLDNKKNAARTQEDCAHYARCLARAIHYVHSRGFIHGDIKPDNALIDEHNDLLLSDFGYALKISDKSNDVYGSRFQGTILYNAPESYIFTLKGVKLNKGFDIYALVIIIYLLTTRNETDPFSGSEKEISEKHKLNTILRCPSTASKELAELVVSGMNLNPDKRPTALDVLKIVTNHKMVFQPTYTASRQFLLSRPPRSNPEKIQEGSFDIIDGRTLGSSSFARIHLAYYNNQSIAYKRYAEDKNIAFQNEKQVLYKLDHPNIITLLGYVENSSIQHYGLLLELGHQTLDHYLRDHQHNARDPAVCKLYAEDITKALHYLHRQNIAHGNINTHNILIVNNLGKGPGVAKLSDFNSSNSINTQEKPADTPSNLPPEASVSHIDISAIGIVLYLLTTASARQALSSFQLFKIILFRRDPRSYYPRASSTASPELQTIIYQSMHAAPERKPTSQALLEVVTDPNTVFRIKNKRPT